MKNKLRKTSLVLLCLIIFSVFFLYVLVPNNPKILVYAIGNPDAHGNVICFLEIYQWNGTHYDLLQNVTTSANWEQLVVPEMAINFSICVRLNNTFASSDNEAYAYTKVLANITQTVEGDIWSNQELDNSSISSDADYYYVTKLGHWNDSGKPASGIDYTVKTRYEGYF